MSHLGISFSKACCGYFGNNFSKCLNLGADMEFVKCFAPERFQKFSFVTNSMSAEGSAVTLAKELIFSQKMEDPFLYFVLNERIPSNPFCGKIKYYKSLIS